MWSFLWLVLITTLVLLIIFAGLVWLKAPVYRLTGQNLIHLFELVLAEEATEGDWDVFLEVPIRYDDTLESIRIKSVDLTERGAVFVNSKRRISINDEAKVTLEGFIERLSISLVETR